MNHENQNEAVQQHLDKLWQDSRNTSFIKSLERGENIQQLIEDQASSEPELIEVIECNDGRCPHRGNEVGIAGSGILASDEGFANLIKQNPGIKTITTHANCGAANLAFTMAKEAGTVPEGITTAEEFAEEWARKKAAQYNLAYHHIGVNEFSDAHHHENGIWVDATGEFHPKQVSGMPNMFVSHSAATQTKNYVGTEINVLTGIGLGDHAFGDRITTEDPFYILISAKDEAEKKDLMEVAKKATEQYGDKVQVKGFVSPYYSPDKA